MDDTVQLKQDVISTIRRKIIVLRAFLIEHRINQFKEEVPILFEKH